MKIAEVVLPLPIEKSFSYFVPELLLDKIKAGIRVKVPFGNRKLFGFVIKTHDAQYTTHYVKNLKEIIEIIDEEPVINDEMMELCKWVSSYYSCPLGKVMHTAVPTQPRKCVKSEVVNEPYMYSLQSTFFIPTPEQNQAIDFIKKYIDDKKYGIALLQGLPGTGKTEVYLQCVAHALDKGKQALILIPEILLTSFFVEKFRNKFGYPRSRCEKVSIFHSGLSRKTHDLEWERIRRNEINVVIGTRSAIFSPLNNLGLIVIDGDEDYSFKEQKEPKYNARDVAIKRAKLNNAFVILTSVAPTIESYYNSAKGKYQIFKFSTVFKESKIPTVEIVDRKKEKGEESSHIISPTLKNAIKDTFKSKEKAILFLNRRGFATVVMCMECGQGFYCPNCQVPMVLHHPPSMLCHYCNYSTQVPETCPNCGTVKLRSFGAGTQRIMNEVKKLFPDARVGRLDTDILSNKSSSKILDNFQSGKINVLVGTQMIPKEEISCVSLLGVISIDAMLNLPDFRSAERTFQILTRFIGVLSPKERTRHSKVIIQTYNPNHYIFSGLKKLEYNEFYKREIKMRKILRYPPFANLVNILVYGNSDIKCSKLASNIAQILKEQKEKNKYKLDILGPAPAFISKLKGKYRYQILIKGKKSAIDKSLSLIRDEYGYGSISERISIDVDPVHML